MFIDTHCHLNMIGKNTFDVPLLQQDYKSIECALSEAHNVGVQKIVNVGTSFIESQNCVTLAQSYAQCYAAVGIHPNDAQQDWQEQMSLMESLWLSRPQHYKIVAIGEVGLDYHYAGYDKQRQHDLFCYAIELALHTGLPIIIHTRDAAQDTLKILEKYAHKSLKGIVHCFSEDYAFARQVIDYGLLLGIGGTLTYKKNDSLRQVCKDVNLGSIVLETDAPFLPPQTMRGTINYPKNIALIAQYLAALRQCDQDLLEHTIQHTTERLFNF